MPIAAYASSTAPEMCAMPPVIIVSSSEVVIRGMKGAMMIGASVWPMKMLAATASDSAPETLSSLVMTIANSSTIRCMTPR